MPGGSERSDCIYRVFRRDMNENKTDDKTILDKRVKNVTLITLLFSAFLGFSDRQGIGCIDRRPQKTTATALWTATSQTRSGSTIRQRRVLRPCHRWWSRLATRGRRTPRQSVIIIVITTRARDKGNPTANPSAALSERERQTYILRDRIPHFRWSGAYRISHCIIDSCLRCAVARSYVSLPSLKTTNVSSHNNNCCTIIVITTSTIIIIGDDDKLCVVNEHFLRNIPLLSYLLFFFYY
jgi:hypothetical protein